MRYNFHEVNRQEKLRIAMEEWRKLKILENQKLDDYADRR